MKNIFKFLFLGLLTFFLFSCDNNGDDPIIGEGSSPELSADNTSVVLMEDNSSEDAITFIWQGSTYGVPVATTNTLEFDIDGNNFAAPIAEVLSNESSMTTFTVAELNSIALNLGALPNVVTDIEVRLRSQVADYEIMYSNPIQLTVTAYESINFINLFLVGNATSAGWNNNNMNQAVFRNPTDTNQFYFNGYFTAGDFKLLESLGNWQPQWGQNGGTLAVNDGSSADPGSFSIPSAGYYTLELNTSALTFNLTPYSGSTTTTYPTIGIIGDATADQWNSDQDMTQSTFNPHYWSVTGITLTAGEAKFRANNDWADNWGASTEHSGIGTPGGANIPIIEAGTYNVYFNDLDKSYLFVKQ